MAAATRRAGAFALWMAGSETVLRVNTPGRPLPAASRLVAGHLGGAQFGVHLPRCARQDVTRLQQGLQAGENGGPAGRDRLQGRSELAAAGASSQADY